MTTRLDTGKSGSTPCPTSFIWNGLLPDPEASLSLQPAATTYYTSTVTTDVSSTSATPASQNTRYEDNNVMYMYVLYV